MEKSETLAEVWAFEPFDCFEVPDVPLEPSVEYDSRRVYTALRLLKEGKSGTD